MASCKLCDKILDSTRDFCDSSCRARYEHYEQEVERLVSGALIVQPKHEGSQ